MLKKLKLKHIWGRVTGDSAIRGRLFRRNCILLCSSSRDEAVRSAFGEGAHDQGDDDA